MTDREALIEVLSRAADSIKPEPGMDGPHGGYLGGITRQKAAAAIESAIDYLAAGVRLDRTPAVGDEGLRAALEAEHYRNAPAHSPGFGHSHPGKWTSNCGICLAKTECVTCATLGEEPR